MEPPNSSDAEMQLLCRLCRSVELIERNGITTEWFYGFEGRELFEAIKALSGQWVPVDAYTIGEELAKRGTLTTIGAHRVIELYASAMTVAGADYWINAVRAYFIRRQLFYLASDVLEESAKPSRDPRELSAEFMDRLQSIGGQS